MTRITMEIGGMSCGHCVRGVTAALKGVSGVEVEQVTVGSASVSYDPATVSAERIAEAVRDQGYEVIGTR